MTERPTFDYHSNDFWPEIKRHDLIPGVGLVLVAERERRKSGSSVAEFYLRRYSKKDVISLGTANWPKATDKAAYIRSCVMALRNATFVAYHTFIVAETLQQVFQRIPPTG